MSAKHFRNVLYVAFSIAVQKTSRASVISEHFPGWNLKRAGLDADFSTRRLGESAPEGEAAPGRRLGSIEGNTTIEPFAFVGCYQVSVDPSVAFGAGAVTSSWSERTPSACASVCAEYELFAVYNETCICTSSNAMSLGAFSLLNSSSCDTPCTDWSASDFPALSSYFASLIGYCGGSINTAAWSIFEQYDAVMAVGPGVVDRSRGLFWQVVLLQVFTGGGGDSEQSVFYNASSWQWHVHASSLSSGRAAFPVQRMLEQPIFGLMIEEHSENPRIIGTSANGDIVAVYVGSKQPPQRVMNGTIYPGHTVDGTLISPGAATVAALDEQRGIIFTTQPRGGEDSELYAIPLDLADNVAYPHIRFVPFCDIRWCAVTELRFRYRGEEVDLSPAATTFLDDLSDVTLRQGAILIDFAEPTMVDEFSISTPYSTASTDPLSWVLEGTNDRVRKCSMSGAPDTQSMPNTNYLQANGEHRDGKPLYRTSNSEILYWDTYSGSWWVSPTIRNGGYGAIRCVEDVFEPYLLTEGRCIAWDGRVWDAAPNISFSCWGNEWTTLHRQETYYPSPEERTAPLRWFKVSRNQVEWSTQIEKVTGHVGMLFADPSDGYLAATTTKDDVTSLQTLGRTVDPVCAVDANVSFEASTGSSALPSQISCAATMFRGGSWHWKDTVGSLKLWLPCASSAELTSNQWVQRYVEVASDDSFGWGSSSLTLGQGNVPVLGQWIRVKEIAVTPSQPDGSWFDGALEYYVCPVQQDCSTRSGLNVRLIPASETCGCAMEVAMIQDHGFYKACYCLTDAPRFATQSVSCAADSDFNLLAGTVIGMGPEPARLLELVLVLGQSWTFGISDIRSQFSGIYRSQLAYTAGDLFSTLEFPSAVNITNATASGCGHNPSACDLVGEVVCTLGEKCSVRLNGTSLQTWNGIKIARSTYGCITPLTYPHSAEFESLVNPRSNCSYAQGVKPGYRPFHIWDLGRPTRGVLGAVDVTEPGPGVYTICWGADPANNVSSYTADQAYPVDAGAFIMMGPFVMDFECSLHFPCTFKISGVGLASTNKVLFIESSLGRCGMPDLPELDAAWSGISNPAPVDDSGGLNVYNVGTAAGKSGASHRLCWAHDPASHNADGTPILNLASEYRVEIDPNFIWIRFTAVVQCILGRECRITLYGIGMAPTNHILLILPHSSCGDSQAVPVSVAGLHNPQKVIDPGVPSSSVGVYILSTSTTAVPRPGFRICWGPNPSNSSAVHFPLEVFYPIPHEHSVFAADRVGSMALVKLDSDRSGRHKALALYADTTMLHTRTHSWRQLDARSDHDCCSNAGFAASAVLEVEGDQAKPSASHVFQDRPVDDLAGVALSVREPRQQGLQCGDACGDDFTSAHTDYVFASVYRDLANPARPTGAAMLLKAVPRGPQWDRAWAAHRVQQHLVATPPQGIADHSVEFRRCATTDPLATCAFVNREYTESLRIVVLSPTRLLATFLSNSLGTAVVINVVHHLPNEWEFNTGLPTLFTSHPTDHCDVAALSSTTALVGYSDEITRHIHSRIIRVDGDGTDDVTLGEVATLGTGNLTMEPTSANVNENVTNETWKYTATHRRLSVCALSSQRALVAFGPIDELAEVALIVVNGLTNMPVVKMTLSSSNIDDVNIVPLGTTKKALAIYRDENDGGVGKAQEVDVFDDYNGASYQLGPGSLTVFTSFRTESLVAIGLNRTTVLAAYRAMDGTEQGRAVLLTASFNS